MGTIFIPSPPGLLPILFGLLKSPLVSSSSSSSPKKSAPRKFESLICCFPPAPDILISLKLPVFLFKFIPMPRFISIILFGLGFFIELLLSKPPSPVSCSPISIANAGLINSFSFSLFSPSTNIFCPCIGFPIFCCIILWKSSGLLTRISSPPCPGTPGSNGGGTGIETSFFISLLKSSSSSSSSLTNPT